MMKMLMALVTSLFLAATSLAAPKTIVLSDKNTVVMRYAFTDESVSKVVAELLTKNASLPAGEPLYLYLDSPGGSVTAGMDLIQAVRGMGREVKTITSFAASMAFITAQALGERIILPNGIMMSHRASGGVEGQMPGEMDSRYAFWRKYIDDIGRATAARLNMSYEEYLQRIYNEWWANGQDAVDQKIADQIADVRCDKSLSGTVKDRVSTLFGAVEVVWHKCPLVKAPLNVNMSNVVFTTMNEVEKREYYEAMHSYFYNRPLFLRKYVITGRMYGIFN